VDEGRGELFVAGGNVAAFVQVTDYELDRLMEAEFEVRAPTATQVIDKVVGWERKFSNEGFSLSSNSGCVR